MSIKPFGRMPDGQEIMQVSLSAGGLSAKFLTYGALLQDLRFQGHDPSLVLGFETLENYLDYSPYFGANAGRCANRIRDGHVLLDGQRYQLDCNFLDKHHLHGGRAGIGKRVWEIEEVTGDSLTLSITLADGEMGYPGDMEISLTYRLLDHGVLDIRFIATTDKTTLCNLAHHSYFNLDGTASIAEHLLQVDADSYTPVDEELIPTGEIRPVANGAFDFRSAKPVGLVSADQILDHNFCLSAERQPIRTVAALESSNSGVSMKIRTTEPGLQVYDGAKVDIPVSGLEGRCMLKHAGIALEPQVWPDAIHHPDFPQAILRPGETYKQHTQYVFSKETK